MAIGRMIIVVLGLILLIYGGGALGLSTIKEMDTTLDWYKSVFQCMIGGAGLVGIGVYAQVALNKAKALAGIKILPANIDVNKLHADVKQSVLESLKETTVVDENKIDTSSWTFLMENYDHLDNLAKNLTEDGDTASIDLCRQLQKRLLDLHHDKVIKVPAPK